ncbi:MAG: thiamine phosphate synthase [Phycisphaeraceae bacterium]|nr:MAG: thiamine phosphate synthase [Phycisphaeraceae bacterium]
METAGPAWRGAWGSSARIIDANLNRAGEALRVLDDLARFALDDASLCARFKALRHDLRGAAGTLPIDPGALASWRDTPGDTGTALTTPGEGKRPGLRAVASAACGRLAEALRSIEEHAKVVAGPSGGAAFEALRYRSYDAERALLGVLGPGTVAAWRLCVLITESLCVHHPWERVAEMAVAGGADGLQLREKSLEGRELVARARRLVAIARGVARGVGGGVGDGRGGVSVVVNDRVDVAMVSGADGVHVGQGDLSVEDVRRVAGWSLAVGVSCSSVEDAVSASRAGADVIGLGPMYASSTKDRGFVAGPGLVRAVLADPEAGRVPHLAIGGIDAGRAGELARAGARGVAVSSAVCGSENPEGACRAILTAMGTGAGGPGPGGASRAGA